MKYIFPRQFGLHNVFTSAVDPKETVQPFKDYTLREQEIAQHDRGSSKNRIEDRDNHSSRQWVPKRLRGETLRLVRKLQIYHSRTSYHQLLEHYCQVKVMIAILVNVQIDDILRDQRNIRLVDPSETWGVQNRKPKSRYLNQFRMIQCLMKTQPWNHLNCQ